MSCKANITVYPFARVNVIQFTISHDFMYDLMKRGKSFCIFLNGDGLDVFDNQFCIVECPMWNFTRSEQPLAHGVYRGRSETEFVSNLGVRIDCFSFCVNHFLPP